MSKRKNRKVASTSQRLKTAIAQEVQRALRSGVQNEGRKVTMELVLPDSQVYINGKQMYHNCIRIPITEAIPAQQGVGQGPDIRRRRSNKIVVTGVNVRASFSVSDETRVLLFPYEPHESIRKYLSGVSLLTEPSAADGLVAERFATPMVPYQNMGIVSHHGPFMVKKQGNGIALDTVDNTPYECRMSTHSGKPIGPVFRKKYGGTALQRTLNWDQGGATSIGMGYTQWKTETVNEYWRLNKQYTYMFEGSTTQMFDRDAEMFMYIDCPSLESKEIDECTPLVGAVIRSVIVDIYYRDM